MEDGKTLKLLAGQAMRLEEPKRHVRWAWWMEMRGPETRVTDIQATGGRLQIL